MTNGRSEKDADTFIVTSIAFDRRFEFYGDIIFFSIDPFRPYVCVAAK